MKRAAAKKAPKAAVRPASKKTTRNESANRIPRASGSARRNPRSGLAPRQGVLAREGYTKLDLLGFYAAAFPRLKPYVKDRMLSLERCPDGMSGSCFFQKEKPQGMPEGTPTQKVQHAKGVTNYVVGGLLETQLALANLGCIAVHVWGSRCQAPRKPDWICFDLDPDSGKFSDAVKAALRVREALDALKLVSFPKTSGGKGLHIFVPIAVGPDCDEVLDFAERLGTHLAAAYPKDFTMESRIANRRGRVYLDPFPQRVRPDRRLPLLGAPAAEGAVLAAARLVGGRAGPRSDGVQSGQCREVAGATGPVEGLLAQAPGVRARPPGRQEPLEAAPSDRRR